MRVRQSAAHVRVPAYKLGHRSTEAERKKLKKKKKMMKKKRRGKRKYGKAQLKENAKYSRNYYRDNKERILENRRRLRKRDGVKVGKRGRPKGSKNKKTSKRKKKRSGKKRKSKKSGKKRKAKKSGKKRKAKKSGKKSGKKRSRRSSSKPSTDISVGF